ncbi:hypothetical protein BDR26DRAFT_859617, partial [Obelidium mucronatum]
QPNQKLVVKRSQPLPKTPSGWTAEWSPEYSKYYFISSATGASQWEHPSSASLFSGQVAQSHQQQREQQIVSAVVSNQEEPLPEYKPQ